MNEPPSSLMAMARDLNGKSEIGMYANRSIL